MVLVHTTVVLGGHTLLIPWNEDTALSSVILGQLFLHRRSWKQCRGSWPALKIIIGENRTENVKLCCIYENKYENFVLIMPMVCASFGWWHKMSLLWITAKFRSHWTVLLRGSHSLTAELCHEGLASWAGGQVPCWTSGSSALSISTFPISQKHVHS